MRGFLAGRGNRAGREFFRLLTPPLRRPLFFEGRPSCAKGFLPPATHVIVIFRVSAGPLGLHHAFLGCSLTRGFVSLFLFLKMWSHFVLLSCKAGEILAPRSRVGLASFCRNFRTMKIESSEFKSLFTPGLKGIAGTGASLSWQVAWELGWTTCGSPAVA